MKSFVVLGKYFDKRKGMANTIANTGSSFGGISMSPFFRFLLDEFRLQGTLLIISGLFLHIFVVCAILRPESFYDKTNKTKKKSTDHGGETEVKMREYNAENRRCIGNSTIEDDTEKTYIPNDSDKSWNIGTYSGFTVQNKDCKRLSEDNAETLQSDVKGDNSNLFVSMNSLVIVGSVRSFDFQSSNERIQNKNTTCCNLLKTSLKNLLDKDLLKNKLFILFNITSFFCAYGCGSTVMYLPPFAKDLGIDDSSIAILKLANGVIRDITQSYLGSFYLIGAGQILA
ncbi:hypothetical protein KUTeg_012380, partial [Tegillarca granosa]